MSNTKIKIEISLETWTKVKKMFEEGRMSYEKLGINNVDEFVNYVIENFANSSKQFDQLSDSMKALMENIDIDNLSFEDLFKNIASSSPKKKDDNNNSNNGENKKS
ncbi:hypothetical protein [Malacoplasma muris]|uniref:hypothetical protein n=1 Tax=Malacoplasma muris TaxID=2119 RepID=UPI00398E91F8